MNDKLAELATRPPTHVLTTRMDGRYLATLAQFWHDRGERPRSSSELLRLSLEGMVELLVSNQMVTFIELHSDAVAALERLGLSTKTQNQSLLAKALAGESLNMEGLGAAQDPFSSARRTKSERKKEGKVVDSLTLQHAQSLLDGELGRELEARAAEAHSRTQEFKDSLLSHPLEGDGGEEESNG